MKGYITNVFRSFIPLALVATILAGLVCVAVQQNIRQSANDPQIQIAEDLANELASGHPVPQISQALNINIAKSLGTFVLIYDNDKKFITGSGQLNGQYPIVPNGVLEYTRTFGEDRITWQPAADVRIALVVARYEGGGQSGFVAVGRSLREIEYRERMLGWYVFGAWLLAMFVSFIVIAGLEIISFRYKS